MQPIRVALVNDHEVVVAGLQALLEPYADRVRLVELVTGTRAGDQADVVLFDSFAQSFEKVRVDDIAPPEVPVVVYTWDERPHVHDVAVDWGAVASVPKSLTAAELVEALEKAHAGARMRPRGVRGGRASGVRRWPGQAAGLTERESEVLALLAAGHSNDEIAALLHLSVNSVKTYLRHAYRKAGVNRRSQATVWALDHGFEPDVSRRPAR